MRPSISGTIWHNLLTCIVSQLSGRPEFDQARGGEIC